MNTFSSYFKYHIILYIEALTFWGWSGTPFKRYSFYFNIILFKCFVFSMKQSHDTDSEDRIVWVNCISISESEPSLSLNGYHYIPCSHNILFYLVLLFLLYPHSILKFTFCSHFFPFNYFAKLPPKMLIFDIFFLYCWYACVFISNRWKHKHGLLRISIPKLNFFYNSALEDTANSLHRSLSLPLCV